MRFLTGSEIFLLKIRFIVVDVESIKVVKGGVLRHIEFECVGTKSLIKYCKTLIYSGISVFSVTEQRIADMSKMSSDLVSASGIEGDFHKRKTAFFRQHSVAGLYRLESLFRSIRYADYISAVVFFVISSYSVLFFGELPDADAPVYFMQISFTNGSIYISQSFCIFSCCIMKRCLIILT